MDMLVVGESKRLENWLCYCFVLNFQRDANKPNLGYNYM